MKALISGATGLIGRSFLTKYSKEFEEVITLGRSQIDNFKNIEMDISDPCLDELPHIDVFFHFCNHLRVSASHLKGLLYEASTGRHDLAWSKRN